MVYAVLQFILVGSFFFQILTFCRNISTSHRVIFVTSHVVDLFSNWLVIAFVNCVKLLLYHFLCLFQLSMTIVRDIHESMILCHGYEIFDIPINVCNLLNVLFLISIQNTFLFNPFADKYLLWGYELNPFTVSF